jgi:hypothetical protein
MNTEVEVVVLLVTGSAHGTKADPSKDVLGGLIHEYGWAA